MASKKPDDLAKAVYAAFRALHAAKRSGETIQGISDRCGLSKPTIKRMLAAKLRRIDLAPVEPAPKTPDLPSCVPAELAQDFRDNRRLYGTEHALRLNAQLIAGI